MQWREPWFAFVVAAREWSQCVSFGNFEVYKKRFDETKGFFEARFEEAERLGGELIRGGMLQQQ